ncbi:MAG TPA: hypothetical protein VJL80_05480 [Aeromicrobium sp.]|nr:hypothetical protein [Aeromicrobium sp.]HKY57471.1 hypothetical protein [Aeromicrobium sp.]
MSHVTSVLSISSANAQFGSQAVRHRIDSGRWQRAARGVVVTHNGPFTDAELDAIALAAAPPDSVLGGLTALRIDGFAGPQMTTRFVVAPPGRRAHQAESVVTHWSGELSPLDVHPNRQPARTRPARSLVDAASWSGQSRRARWIVIAGVQQGLATPEQIRDSLERRGHCRHRGVILESTYDAEGGKHSLPERDFALIWSALQLPPLEHQEPVRDKQGRFFLDAWCPHLGFGVEVHGIPHRDVANWDADVARANEVIIRGRPHLTFTSYAVRHERLVVADQLQRMAATRDWAPRVEDSSLRRLLRPKRQLIERRTA